MIWNICGWTSGSPITPLGTQIEFDWEQSLDDSGNLILWKEVFNEDTGTQTIEYFYPPDLINPVVYTGSLHPVGERFDVSWETVCVETPFGIYVVGDKLTEVKIVDLNTPSNNATVSYYDATGVHIPAATAGPNVGACDVSSLARYEKREKEDLLPDGQIEYVELVEIDDTGVETTISTALADGTPYTPTAPVQEFRSSPGCCFDIYRVPAQFRVDAFAQITLKPRPDLGGSFLFHPNDAQDRMGIILTIDDYIETRPGVTISSVQWASFGNLIGPYVDNNTALGAVGTTSNSIFLATHDMASNALHLGLGRVGVRITLSNGIVFSATCLVGAPVNGTLAINRVGSASIRVSQAQGSEVQYDMITYQPNVQDVFQSANYVLNDDPLTGFSTTYAFSTPCGFVFGATSFQQHWNLSKDPSGILGVCDEGGTFTQSSVGAAFNFVNMEFAPIGTDLPSQVGLDDYGYLGFNQGGLDYTPSTIYSFD